MQIQNSRSTSLFFIVVLTLISLFFALFPDKSRGEEGKVEFNNNYNFRSLLFYALENANEIKIAHHRKEISRAELEKSKSSFLPELGLTLSQGLERQKKEGTPFYSDSPSDPWVSSLSLTGKQNLYNNGEDLRQYEKSMKQYQIAEKEENEVRDELLLKIAQNYFQYSLLKKNIDIKTTNNELLLKQFNLVTNQYKQGYKTKIDYLRFKVQVEQGNLELKSLKSDLENLETSLKKQSGIGMGKNIEFMPLGNEIIGKGKFDLENKEEIQFKGQRLEEIGLQKIKIAEIEENSAEKKRWPILNLETNLGYGVNDYLSSKESFHQNYGITFNALLKVTYNIFDGGRTTQDILIQKYQKNIVTIDYDEKKREWEEKTISLKNDYKKLKENLNLSLELTKLEEISFNTVQEDYRTGKVAFLDYVSALSSYTTSKLNYYKNIFELNKTILDFYHQQGKVYDVLFEN